MSEKPQNPDNPERQNGDFSIEELEGLVQTGLKNQALRLAKIEVEKLEPALASAMMAVADDTAEINKFKWIQLKEDLENQITELQDFIAKNDI